MEILLSREKYSREKSIDSFVRLFLFLKKEKKIYLVYETSRNFVLSDGEILVKKRERMYRYKIVKNVRSSNFIYNWKSDGKFFKDHCENWEHKRKTLLLFWNLRSKWTKLHGIRFTWEKLLAIYPRRFKLWSSILDFDQLHFEKWNEILRRRLDNGFANL